MGEWKKDIINDNVDSIKEKLKIESDDIYLDIKEIDDGNTLCAIVEIFDETDESKSLGIAKIKIKLNYDEGNYLDYKFKSAKWGGK
jgi:hypothetical protein